MVQVEKSQEDTEGYAGVQDASLGPGLEVGYGTAGALRNLARALDIGIRAKSEDWGLGVRHRLRSVRCIQYAGAGAQDVWASQMDLVQATRRQSPPLSVYVLFLLLRK